MNEIKQYYDLLQTKPKISELPYYDKEAPVTVTFVNPLLNAEGMYKMIIPAMALNKHSPYFRCLITGISKYVPTKHIDKYDMVFTDEFIAESNYLVLPFVSFDLEPVITQIKEVNPDCKVAYHVDFNFADMPEHYPFRQEYEPAKVREVILKNMYMSDKVIFSNKTLSDYMFEKLRGGPLKGSGTVIHHQMLFMDSDHLSDIEMPKKRIGGPFRVLIVANESHYQDLNPFRAILQDINKRFGDKVEIMVFGYDGKNSNMRHALRDVNYKHISPVSYFKYYKRLAELNPDAAFIPVKDTPFNQMSKNYVKFIEFTALMIPTFVPAIPPFNELVSNEVNGIMCEKKEDWIKQLEVLINEHELRSNIAENSMDYTMNYMTTLNEHNLLQFHHIFDIPQE